MFKKKRKKRNPTDIKILETIYNNYYIKYLKECQNRSSKIYVSIDIKSIANELNSDDDLIFCRLYYYLENKYGYFDKENSRVYFFALEFGKDKHCINFPYLASILSDLQDKQKKFILSTIIAILSLLISIISIITSIST